MRKKVFVGLSGGVDSAVAALLLQQEGYDVTGVFLKNWSGNDYGISEDCPWKEDLKSAREVADFLQIELKVYNFEKEYRELVIEDFFYQYSIGNTPSPDILCNKYIKFDKFLTKALSDGADLIATGHYAKTINGKLYNAKDSTKDQTYFLHQLTNAQLSSTLFPLSNLLKSEVREIAKAAKLPNFNRKDSQGICFIGKVDIEKFLSQRLKTVVGEIVDVDSGRVVGAHNGVWFYTIGQRQGLHIGGLKVPYFVCSKDVESNRLYVAQGKSHPKLWTFKYIVEEFHTLESVNESDKITGIIRYRAKPTNADLKLDSSKAIITFNEKQWAATLGQSIVLYNSDQCVGGGIITEIVE